MHRYCSLEIKVHYLDSTLYPCCFPFSPRLTSARNQIQMAPARLNSYVLHSVPSFQTSSYTMTGSAAVEFPLSHISSRARPISHTIFGICHAKRHNSETKILAKECDGAISRGSLQGTFQNVASRNKEIDEMKNRQKGRKSRILCSAYNLQIRISEIKMK